MESKAIAKDKGTYLPTALAPPIDSESDSEVSVSSMLERAKQTEGSHNLAPSSESEKSEIKLDEVDESPVLVTRYAIWNVNNGSKHVKEDKEEKDLDNDKDESETDVNPIVRYEFDA